MKREILGLQINTEPKHKILAEISNRALHGQKTIIVTPYSEFFYYAAKDYRFRNIVNDADFALPDGIALQWLAEYYSHKLSAQNYYLKILQAAWQEIAAGFGVLFSKKIRSRVISERISGADFFWDIISEADKNSQKVFLLGGFDDTAQRVIKKVLKKYPGLLIGSSNANPNENQAIEEINDFAPDYLMVAYGPVKQEYWISEHLQNSKAVVAIGIGGTLDYVSGVKKRPPKFVRALGMEWLYRLITQPYRYKRIWHATVSLGIGAVRDKVFKTLGYRQNSLGVIINEQKKVLIVCRSRERSQSGKNNHWQFPQGGIEPGESPEQGVLREMREELGTGNFSILGMCSKTYLYEWQHFFRPLLSHTWRFKGQQQHIFYLKFNGSDSEFSLDKHEINDFKWVSPEELHSYIYPMRHEMLNVALSELPKNIAKI